MKHSSGRYANLAAKIREAAAAELQKAQSTVSPDQVEATFNSELAAIEKVIVDSDINSALRLLPAKELLNRLAPTAGCKNASDLMRSLRRNFKPQDFAEIKELAADIGTIASASGSRSVEAPRTSVAEAGKG